MENMTKEAWAAKIQSLYNQFIEQRANKPAAATAKGGEEKDEAKAEDKAGGCKDGTKAGLKMPILADIAPIVEKILSANGDMADGLGKCQNGKIFIDGYAALCQAFAQFQSYPERRCQQEEFDKLSTALVAFQRVAQTTTILSNNKDIQAEIGKQSTIIRNAVNAAQKQLNDKFGTKEISFSFIATPIITIVYTPNINDGDAISMLPALEAFQMKANTEVSKIQSIFNTFATEIKAYFSRLRTFQKESKTNKDKPTTIEIDTLNGIANELLATYSSNFQTPLSVNNGTTALTITLLPLEAAVNIFSTEVEESTGPAHEALKENKADFLPRYNTALSQIQKTCITEYRNAKLEAFSLLSDLVNEILTEMRLQIKSYDKEIPKIENALKVREAWANK